MAERRQALRFPFPMAFLSIRNFTQGYPVRRSFLSAACRPRIVLAFVYGRNFQTAGKVASQSFHQPRSDWLHRIYTIALYVNYPTQSHHFYFNVSREDWSRPLGSAAPHPLQIS